ncbi:MAG: hypothetical protein Alis3KO_41010 [Aliiglaciecola sp.]
MTVTIGESLERNGLVHNLPRASSVTPSFVIVSQHDIDVGSHREMVSCIIMVERLVDMHNEFLSIILGFKVENVVGLSQSHFVLVTSRGGQRPVCTGQDMTDCLYAE